MPVEIHACYWRTSLEIIFDNCYLQKRKTYLPLHIYTIRSRPVVGNLFHTAGRL